MDAAELAVAPNLWRREFSECYEDARPIGPCAAVLNGSSAPMTLDAGMLRQRYGRVLVPQGGDLIYGGTVSSQPFSGSITLPPGAGALLGR